jgi:hypothetical protein
MITVRRACPSCISRKALVCRQSPPVLLGESTYSERALFLLSARRHQVRNVDDQIAAKGPMRAQAGRFTLGGWIVRRLRQRRQRHRTIREPRHLYRRHDPSRRDRRQRRGVPRPRARSRRRPLTRLNGTAAAGATIAEATKRRLVFASLRGYQRSSLRSDVLAGLTVWAPVVDCCNDAGRRVVDCCNDAGRRLAVQGARLLSTRDH